MKTITTYGLLFAVTLVLTGCFFVFMDEPEFVESTEDDKPSDKPSDTTKGKREPTTEKIDTIVDLSDKIIDLKKLAAFEVDRIKDMVVANNTLYVLGKKLSIYDVSDPTFPQLLSEKDKIPSTSIGLNLMVKRIYIYFVLGTIWVENIR